MILNFNVSGQRKDHKSRWFVPETRLPDPLCPKYNTDNIIIPSLDSYFKVSTLPQHTRRNMGEEQLGKWRANGRIIHRRGGALTCKE